MAGGLAAVARDADFDQTCSDLAPGVAFGWSGRRLCVAQVVAVGLLSPMALGSGGVSVVLASGGSCVQVRGVGFLWLLRAKALL